MLVVLPIFLFYCISSLKKNPDMKDNPATGFIIVLFYIFGGMAVLIDLILLGHVLKYF